MSSSDSDDDHSAVVWLKVAFIITGFLEGLIGWLPTCWKGCRESPKALGIANAFAGGVFIAIALMHILPEQSQAWNDYKRPMYPPG